MKHCFFQWPPGWMVLVVFPFLLLGCAMTEQEARAKIDYTPSIIQQSADLLAADPELNHYSIAVEGFKNDMWLRGEVATQAQKERVARLVWAARGVRSVDNQIRVQKR